MNHALLDTTEVVATYSMNGTDYEVCAEAEATHDKRAHLLTVHLRSYLRSLSPESLHEQAQAPWLPEPETLTEGVEVGEAHDLAMDIFASWCRRVLACLPEL